MKVWACNPSGLPDRTKRLISFHQIAQLHIDAAHMAIHGYEALSVIQQHGVAIEEIVSRRYNFAGGRCRNRCTFRRSYVETTVGVSWLIVKKSSQTKWA
mgnify:CR=1 FL=1